MKKNFNKEINMTTEENKNFESSIKCWICDNTFIGDLNPLTGSIIVENYFQFAV